MEAQAQDSNNRTICGAQGAVAALYGYAGQSCRDALASSTAPNRTLITLNAIQPVHHQVIGALSPLGLREAGSHTATFDGRSLMGGLYLVRLEASGVVQTQRITLVR